MANSPKGAANRVVGNVIGTSSGDAAVGATARNNANEATATNNEEAGVGVENPRHARNNSSVASRAIVRKVKNLLTLRVRAASVAMVATATGAGMSVGTGVAAIGSASEAKVGRKGNRPRAGMNGPSSQSNPAPSQPRFHVRNGRR